MNEPDCILHTRHELGYIEFFADAAKRHKRGERQQRCPLCRLWIWPDHYHQTQEKDLRMYGYFDAPGQTKPAFDPGLNVKCPFCKNRMKRTERLVSISVCGIDDTRSYFYRAHRDCYDSATDEEKALYDELPLNSGSSNG